jgi:transposase
VHVILPDYGKKYAQSLGLKSKTDKLDAKIQAQMGMKQELHLRQPVGPTLLGLKQPTRERDAPVRIRTTAANQSHAYGYRGKPSPEAVIRT